MIVLTLRTFVPVSTYYIFKYINIIDKLHPNIAKNILLITQIFVPVGDRTHDLWFSSQGLLLDQQT